MLFIEYPKCSTCQKAKCWLDKNGVLTPTAIFWSSPPPMKS